MVPDLGSSFGKEEHFPNLQLTKDEIGFLKRRIDDLSAPRSKDAIGYGAASNNVIDDDGLDFDGDDNDSSVSSTGSWCREASKSNSRQHLTDLKLAGFLAELLDGD